MTYEYIVYGIVVFALTKIAQELLVEDLDQPIQEQKPGQFSEEGTWLPLLIGRMRLGSNQGKPWAREVQQEDIDGAGGKGFGGGGSASKQTVYYENGWHRIAVSTYPREMALYRIFSNGTIVWEGELRSNTDPSGTQVDLPDNEGSFRIYWGAPDQPIDPDLTAGLNDHPSRWPMVVHVVWIRRRLGGFAVWQAHEYEFEASPWRPGTVGLISGIIGDSYYYNGFGVVGNALFINVANNDSTPSVPPRPNVGVFGDQTNIVTSNGIEFIRLIDQPNITPTKNYRLFSANHIASPNHFQIQGQENNKVYPDTWFEYQWNLIDWFIPQGADAANFFWVLVQFTGFGGNVPPPGSLVDEVQSPYHFRMASTPASGMIGGASGNFHIEALLTRDFVNFSTGTQEWEVYFRNCGTNLGQVDRIHIGFENGANPLIHNAIITFTESGGIDIEVIEGLECKVTNVGSFGSSPDWFKVEIRYYTLNGFTVSTTSEGRRLRIKAFAYQDDYDTQSVFVDIWHKYWSETGDPLNTFDSWAQAVIDFGFFSEGDVCWWTGIGGVGPEQLYRALSNHAPVSTNEPGQGSSWTSFWEVIGDRDELGNSLFERQLAFFEIEGVAQSNGITKLFLDEELTGAQASVGTLELLGTGGTAAPGGANPAFILQQLLFAEWPQGIGLDTDRFEYLEGDYSLQALADQLGNTETGEGLRSHVFMQRGENVRNVLNNLLLELGIVLVWNPDTGKIGFKAIRPEPTTLDIPSKLIKQSPQRVKALGSEAPNNTVYKYLDYDKRFRPSTIPKPDDGNTALRARLDVREHSILTATDLETADSIAQRIDSIGGGQNNIRKFIGLRGTRNMRVGDLVTLEGVNEAIRILQIGPIDVDSTDVPIEGAIDTLSEVANVANATAPPTGPDRGGLPDVSRSLINLPNVLSPEEDTYVFVRVREDNGSAPGVGLVSRDDISYEQVPVTDAVGGILLRDIPADTVFRLPVAEDELSPILFQAQGPDTLTLIRTLTEVLLAGGEQLMYMNGEFFFIGGVTAKGEGIFEISSAIRARFGSERVAHSAGDQMFIIQRRGLAPFKHPLVHEGDVYIKSAPRGFDFSTVTPDVVSLANESFAPRPVVSLRNHPYGSTAIYYSGDDFDFRWSYIHPQSKTARTGAGYQGAGELTGVSQLYDSYFEVVIDPLGFDPQTFNVTDTFYRLSNFHLRSYCDDTEPIFDFKVTFVYRGRRSATRKLTLTKLAAPVPV